ncbi:MAG: DUF885 family protein [Acidobacteria bacterium]|nr:DUF885 family protein [Acidobacteriota bacterium]
MKRPASVGSLFLMCALLGAGVACSSGGAPSEQGVGGAVSGATPSTDYNDLLELFNDWREFARPRWVGGVPDYSTGAMAEQHAELAGYQARLAAIDESGWPVAEQIDHHLVRAEMNGLDFDHRVRRPWANNPAFYVTIFSAQSDVPAHEGPVIDGWLDTWAYEYPLDEPDAVFMASHIDSIPVLLQQARANLTGNGHDLWRTAPPSFAAQGADLQALAERIEQTSGNLDADVRAELEDAIEQAIVATDEFRAWLGQEAPSKTGTSGVGRDNHTWYLQNVHLLPYTWEQEETILLRELARAHASLRLEENRNRELAELSRVDNATEYDRVFNEAVDEMIAFLEEEEIFTMADYMGPALRARIGSFSPADGLRGFFSEVSYRDALTMRAHGVHWIDLALMEYEPHESPIRRVPPLSNIYDNRSEGLATAFEEMMMHAGLFDDRPRARELIWILLAQRAARGLGGLRQHANVYTLQEAAEFASEWTPRGFLPADGATIQGEEHFYLTQPGYGTSYIIGKLEIEKLMAERAIQLGDEFTIKRFFDEFLATGVIPVSLIRWQLTGNKDPILEVAR